MDDTTPITTSPWRQAFFGEPWPSGICDDGHQEPTPVGVPCLSCREAIGPDDRGTFMFVVHSETEATWQPQHIECGLRTTMGGIGHLEDHSHWCSEKHDPDGGRTYRQSALEVWEWVQRHGVSAGVEKSVEALRNDR